MAYDPVKAHEYYEKYVKKGLKKGRNKKSTEDTKKKSTKKKGSTKKAAKSSLIGFSTSGLNDQGKIEATLLKEKITNEMNAALAKETTAEGKEKIRREYSQKGIEAVNKLKSDSKYAAATKTSTKSSGSTKSSSGSSSKSSSSGSSSSGSTKSSSKSSNSSSGTSSNTVSEASAVIDTLKKAFESMSDTDKAEMKTKISSLITELMDRSQKLTKNNILSKLQSLTLGK